MTIELGDNYELKENSNGNLEVVDADGSAVLTHDNSADQLVINDPTEIKGTITDAAGVAHSGELADATDLDELADATDVVSDHGNLSGLGDDDHPIYLLADGSRALTGSLDAGGNDVTNVGKITLGTDTLAQAVVASGQVQLSSGTAVVDTGLSATDATFQLAIGIDDPDADAKVSGRLFWDDSAGTYKIEIVESDTSVGNPTVNYDIVRVR
jgi:hypothetical protein